MVIYESRLDVYVYIDSFRLLTANLHQASVRCVRQTYPISIQNIDLLFPSRFISFTCLRDRNAQLAFFFFLDLLTCHELSCPWGKPWIRSDTIVKGLECEQYKIYSLILYVSFYGCNSNRTKTFTCRLRLQVFTLVSCHLPIK